MRKIKEILRLHFEAKLSNHQIASSLKVAKGTVFNTLERFKNSGLCWDEVHNLSEDELGTKLYRNPQNLSLVPLKTAPDYQRILEDLKHPHTTLQLLYEEFKNAHPEGVGRTVFYEGFRQYISKKNVTMKQIHTGGDKVFVDYSGDSKEYIDRKTGEVKSTQMFVASWGASSYCYVEFTDTQKQEDWVGSHVRMTEYFDSVSHALVPDNLKQGVLKPCLYEPEINPLYLEMAKHYGTCVLPARVRKPRDKGVVESNVLHLQMYILGRLRNRTFYSLQELNEVARELLEEFNNRPMKDYGGKSRKERFLVLDKPYAIPLPIERFTISKIKENVTVGPNYHIEFDKHHYSVPYTLVKEKVTVYRTGELVEIYHQGQQVVRHRRQPPNYKYTTVSSHMPKSHQFVKGMTPSWLIFKGGEIGPNTSEAIKVILNNKKHPEQGYKSSLGIIRLSSTYRSQRLENACKRALYFGSVSYRSVKAILEKSLDSEPLADHFEEDVPLSASHENLRGSHYYTVSERKGV